MVEATITTVDGHPLILVCEDRNREADVVEVIRKHLADPEWQSCWRQDLASMNNDPDLLELHLKTPSLKQAVRTNRKLPSPLANPLKMAEGALIDEALSSISDQNPGQAMVLCYAGLAACYKPSEAAGLPTGICGDVAVLLEDMWPDLPTGQWYILACGGTRTDSCIPGLLSHVIALSDCGAVALAFVWKAMASTLDLNPGWYSNETVVPGSGDRPVVLTDEQAWSILSATYGAVEKNLTGLSLQRRGLSLVLTLQGRGRSLGTFRPNKMVRLGVSRWR